MNTRLIFSLCLQTAKYITELNEHNLHKYGTHLTRIINNDYTCSVIAWLADTYVYSYVVIKSTMIVVSFPIL